MTFNPHTATLDELRDWLAREDGWVYLKNDPIWGDVWERRVVNALGDSVHSLTTDHPYPPTIDGAAAALPEGCRWTFNGEGFFAWKMTEWIPLATTASTGDEITDRYRLACLARVAMKEDSK